jgi:hypothetical protein
MRDIDGEFLNATSLSSKRSRIQFVKDSKILVKPGPSADLVIVPNQPVVAGASGLSSLFSCSTAGRNHACQASPEHPI